MNKWIKAGLAGLCVLSLTYVALTGPRAGASQDKKPVAEKGVKTVQAFYARMAGDWVGPYRLWLRPGVPVQEYRIKARFTPVAKGHYFLMSYSWKNDSVKREGVFFLGGKGNKAYFSWGDSFHMTSEPMVCKGKLSKDGKKLIFKGSYSMGNSPTWGWRTEFTLKGKDAILMEAFNIHPSGREMKAVEARMKRSAKERK